MQNSPKQQNFISGIYNYCDRWCERCELTDRCRVFADERASPIDDDSLDMDVVVQKLTTIFAETKQMLIEKAEELGIDPFAMSDEEFAEIREREKQFVDEDDLARLGEKYWRSAREILEADWLAVNSAADNIASDVIDVLNWYLFFIPVKIKSGLHGLLDVDGYEDKAQLSDSQSDANGTIKVGLIAIERSILAWTYLLETDTTDSIQPMIELLNEMKCGLEKRFPLARDFVRPGFDEMPTVM
jgi:hypothetical protein